MQVVLINVSDDEADAVEKLRLRMVEQGLRPETDRRDETMGYRVRDAIGQKVPYIGVIGKKEVAEGTVSVRKRGENKSASMKIDELDRTDQATMRRKTRGKKRTSVMKTS